VSLSVREGEIVGVAGLVGSGKTELARAIFGADEYGSGEIIFDGKKVGAQSPNRAIQLGMGLLPEDRRDHGLILPLNVRENIGLPNLPQFIRFGFIDLSREAEETSRYMQEVNIRPADPLRRVEFLSGGNQQKVVVAKWLCSKSKVYIFDEPTRGIDVGAKAEVYKVMALLAEAGAGVLMVSSEIPEIQGMCDRVFVMYKGRVAAEFSCQETTRERILAAALRGEKAS
jgi:ribose transport system ATP-binding protein